MKFYIQESTGSHRCQTAGDIPEDFNEVDEATYNTFVATQKDKLDRLRVESRDAKTAAAVLLVDKLVEVTSLDRSTINLALGLVV